MNNILERLDMASDNLKTIQQPKHNHAISPTGPKNNEMQNQASVLHNKITTTTDSSANTSHNSIEDPHHIPTQTNSRNNFKEASARINGSENATALQAAQTGEIDIKQECDAVVVKVEEPGEATHDSNNVGVTSTENLIFAKPRPILLSSVNLHIICHLCKGYLIDATTIVECLHSFCHSCLIKHLRMEQYCPRCEMMINTAKPNIKPDTTLQAIVYKLVPGLYERELMRKRAFYKDRPEDAALATPEQRGDDTEHLIFSPSDYMSLSLEYADIEEHIGANSDYSELLKPRYLRCPAMYTVGLLKKFVHGKFNIDPHRFRIDIMYKVKTIVLLDHYTLMDVAYIYTWKRDDPMRFYFRVKHSLKPMAKLSKLPAPTPLLVLAPTPLPLSLPSVESIVVKEEKSSTSNNTDGNEESTSNSSVAVVRTIVHQLISHTERDGECMLLPPEDIKVEDETDLIPVSRIPKKHESLNQAKSSTEPKTPDIEKLVLPNNFKEMKENCVEIAPSPADASNGERKVENIKLKIDLSKQNSVTIINMSDPQRKEITKPVKPDKEWKVKNKKERASSSKCTPNNERKHKTASPLTVPPLTIKAEQISPKAKSNSSSHNSSTTLSNVFHSLQTNISEEEKKSKFLMSFALTPIKNLKLGTPEKQKSPNTLSKPTISLSLPLMESKSPPIAAKNPLRTTASVLFKSTIPSKRKSKEPVKTISKKAKLSPPLSNDDFKIKLPPAAKVNTKVDKTITSAPTLQTESSTSKTTTLATSTPSMMRPPVGVPPKKSLCTSQKGTLSSVRPPQSMQRIQIAAPGNRTPIAKRYQPILPKTVRLNPFANIPSDVNKILKDAGTEIKTIVNNAKMSKVYGPKTSTTATTNESTLMGPPPLPPAKHSRQGAGAISPHRLSTGSKSTNSKSMSSVNNYLNMALYNSTKSKGNEVPPGCRTPIYTPNSPIYSPSSPQYVPSYTIPTVPTYKYTPKPTGSNNSNFLQNVLGGSSQLANLFPAPPTKKEDPGIASACHITPTDSGVTTKAELQPKRVYPFARSPSPAEDPPEKQLKVKSLLTSCNINIPSSLSITITREDVETQSNSQSHPKHKSPVNNYIEILKLPDHPAEHESGRRTTPPTQKTPTVTTPEAIVKKNCSDVKSAAGSISAQQQQTTQKLMQRVSVPSSSSLSSPTTNSHKQTCTGSTSTSNSMMSVPSCNSKAVMLPRMKNTTTTNLNTSQKPVSEGAGNVQKSNQKISQTTGLLNMQHSVQLQNQQQEPTKQANATQSQVHDKKTPSPEKRPVSNFSSSPVDKTKLPSNPNASADAVGQVGKKFRPILPRQEPIPVAEVVPPKVTTANVIGTYSAPSGVAVKVHANKKVSPPKKSPSSLQQQQQHQMPNTSSGGGSTQKSPRNTPSPLNAPKSTPNTNTHRKSPPSAYQNNSFATSKTVVSKATSVTPPPPSTIAVNALNKLLSPHPTLATLPPAAIQAAITSGLPNITPHLGVAAATSAAVGQADFNKFLKDNLLRAQVQAAAAAASQPVMFYPYPNGTATAAQLSHHYSSSMYQQAYMIEQLTRMQRAEALSDYMQKLKHGLENSLTPTVESGGGNNKVSPASLPSSPKATAESGATPPTAVPQDQSTSTVKQTFPSRSK